MRGDLIDCDRSKEGRGNCESVAAREDPHLSLDPYSLLSGAKYPLLSSSAGLSGLL